MSSVEPSCIQLDITTKQALELGKHRQEYVLAAEVGDDSLLDLAVLAVGFDDADVFVDGAVAGANFHSSGIHERARASLAKRIGLVRPGIASTITTIYRGFKVNSRRLSCVHQYKLSLRLTTICEGPGAQSLKK